MLRKLLLFLLALCAFAAGKANRPYVLLISLDGFRYDYATRDHATNLLDLARNGVAAKALIPSFPTTTFPNHYTIVTGLYPARHGIVENSFWDPRRKASFQFNDPARASDPAWWGGTPLWVLAEQQGVHAASYFWPGTDYEIQHIRPTYYHPFDSKVTKDQQIQEVVHWLKLPEAERPHFITVYMSEVDHQAHSFGPDAPETREAISSVDAAVGKLVREVRATGLPVDVFVVSDHGMVAVTGSVDLSSFADLSRIETASAATDFKIYSSDAAKIDELYAKFAGKDPRFEAYRQADIPARLHYSGNDRIGDLVLLATKPVMLLRPGAPARSALKGSHGYDVAQVPEMKAIFYAQGPDLKAGIVIDEFENIHIFPLIAHILGLKVPDNIDGTLSVLAPILKSTR